MDDADLYVLRQTIASLLDYPSVYMGGPSWSSVQKAIRVVRTLSEEYDIKPNGDSISSAERVRTWRTRRWDDLAD